MGIASKHVVNNYQHSPTAMPITSKPTRHYDSPARPTSPAFDVEDDDFNDNNDTGSPQIEQLLMNHLRFAHAFRKNDAAIILQFLAKDVTLVSVDGTYHEGQSAVLAYLVGARMTKISANLRVKGCPTRSGQCQSTFIYEHGIVFKDPLFMEVLDWKPNSPTIVRIAHIALPDAKSGKPQQDFGKSQPLRLSFGNKMSDDEDSSNNSSDSDGSDTGECENNHQTKIRCRRLTSENSAAMTAVTAAGSRYSSSSSSSQSGVSEPTVQRTADNKTSTPTITLAEISCTGLTPIRKRKTVNPFIILQCPETGSVWKSPVMKRNPNPKWKNVPIVIPVDTIADVVEISLWDHTLFHSVKVAGAALVVSDFLRNDAEFSANIQLEKFDAARAAGEPESVTLQFRFVRSNVEYCSSNEVERNSVQKFEAKSGHVISTLYSSIQSFVKPLVDDLNASVLLMLLRAAIVAIIVWMLYVIPKQV